MIQTLLPSQKHWASAVFPHHITAVLLGKVLPQVQGINKLKFQRGIYLSGLYPNTIPPPQAKSLRSQFRWKMPSLSLFSDVSGPAAVCKRGTMSEMQGDMFGLRTTLMEVKPLSAKAPHLCLCLGSLQPLKQNSGEVGGEPGCAPACLSA